MRQGPDKDEYFQRVEEHFGRRRGGPLLLSPRDWKLVDDWYEEGIPLSVVLRGINRAFDRFADTAARPDRINSLRYCRQHVETLWHRRAVAGSGAREDGAAGAGGAGGAGSAADHLRNVAELCRRRAGQLSRLAAALHRAAEELDRLASRVAGGELGARDIDLAARALEEELEDALSDEPWTDGTTPRLGLPSFSPYEL